MSSLALAFLDIKWDGQITFGNVVTIISTFLGVSAIYWKQQIFNRTQKQSSNTLTNVIAEHGKITNHNSEQINILRESDIRIGKDVEFIKEKIVSVTADIRDIIDGQKKAVKNLNDTKDEVIHTIENKI